MKTRVYVCVGVVVLGASIALGHRWLSQPPDKVAASHGDFAGRFQPVHPAPDRSQKNDASDRSSHIGSIQQLPPVNLSRP